MEQRQDREQQNPSRPGAQTAEAGSFRYRAFISYSHEDQPWADWLIKALETYRVPQRLRDAGTSSIPLPRRLTPIFRDRDELASASDLGDTIRGALADSANLIVVCSPASANSRWVNEEIRAFQRLGRGNRIFCLIVAGEPNASALPGQEYKECLAPALRETRDETGASTHHFIEPAAADVRPGMDSKATARLKLVAGLLGVGLDNLRRRDQLRRTRRMIAVTALAVVITAITTTLAITAFFARRSAEAAQQTAERRQKQAEDLVNFMLGDLNDKLREVNRLDILQSVDDKAMAYFASLPVADVTDQSLALRAKALQKIGSVRMGQGHYKRALDALLLAVKINRQRLDPAKPSPAHLTEYGNSLIGLGNAYMNLAENTHSEEDYHAAETSYRAADDALSRALIAEPDNAKTQLLLAYSHNNLAYFLKQQNQPGQAVAMYRKQIALLQHLNAADPKNPTYALSLAKTGINVADLDLDRGQLIDSIHDLIAPNQVLSDMARDDPDNRNALTYLMISRANLADSLHAAGQQKLALQYIASAADIGDELVRFDPDHVDWQWLRNAYGTVRARWELEIHPGSASALNQLKQLRIALQGMLKSHPENSSIRRSLANVHFALALADRHAGRADRAMNSARSALASLHRLTKRTMENAANLRVACATELLLAQLHVSKRPEHARRALGLIQPIAEHSRNPANLSLWAEALLANGHRDHALALIRELRGMGYRTPSFTATLARRRIDYVIDPGAKDRLDAVLADVHPLAPASASPKKASAGTPP